MARTWTLPEIDEVRRAANRRIKDEWKAARWASKPPLLSRAQVRHVLETAEALGRPMVAQIRLEVVEFARLMEDKLRANDHKRHWRESLAVYAAYGHLLNEVNELLLALKRGDASEIASECADIANYAMMVADLADGLPGRGAVGGGK